MPNNTHHPVIPVIISGGSGKRLWPWSRAKYPKQLLKLYDAHSLLQDTVLRCENISGLLPPILIFNKNDRFSIHAQLRAIQGKTSGILMEEKGHNTAPAVASAAIFAQDHFGDALLLIMPIDHKIEDIPGLAASLVLATPAATNNQIVIFGVKPRLANTNYGYIQVEKELSPAIFSVKKFTEKPAKKLAERFIKDDSYYWNSGIYLAKASRFLADFASYRPDLLTGCQKAYAHAAPDPVLNYPCLAEEFYQTCPTISIDYAITERAKEIVMVPLQSDWIDIGGWQSLYNIDKKDGHGNVTHGNIVALDTQNSYIRTQHRLLVSIGISDCFMIETRDVVLMAHRDHLDKVQNVFTLLEENNREEALNSATVHRPWGHYLTIETSVNFQIKKIVVFPRQKLSLQEHQYRSEHWVILKGKAKITLGHEEHILGANQSIYVPIGMRHRIENLQDNDLEFIEVQIGTYLGEDDIKRFDDIYQRANQE